MKRALIAIVAVLGLGAGIGYLVTGGGSFSSGGASTSSGPVSQRGEGVAIGAPAGVTVPAPGAPARAGSDAALAGGGAIDTSSVPSVGPEIVKTAQLSVQV